MSAEQKQRAYYERTATVYDDWHEEPEHPFALAHVVRYLEWLNAETVLDTGCGTGRAMLYIRDQLPKLRLRGNDPSEALLDVAVKNGIAREDLDVCGSERLPYPDESFDVAIAVAVMHHVRSPEPIIAEMLRVARLAVFISDGNIYGQGRMPARVLKLLLARARLLNTVNWVRRGGKLWHESEGDGIAYSYSVFDSFGQLNQACKQVLVIPTSGDREAGRNPLLHARQALACGFKVPLPT